MVLQICNVDPRDKVLYDIEMPPVEKHNKYILSLVAEWRETFNETMTRTGRDIIYQIGRNLEIFIDKVDECAKAVYRYQEIACLLYNDPLFYQSAAADTFEITIDDSTVANVGIEPYKGEYTCSQVRIYKNELQLILENRYKENKSTLEKTRAEAIKAVYGLIFSYPDYLDLELEDEEHIRELYNELLAEGVRRGYRSQVEIISEPPYVDPAIVDATIMPFIQREGDTSGQPLMTEYADEYTTSATINHNMDEVKINDLPNGTILQATSADAEYGVPIGYMPIDEDKGGDAGEVTYYQLTVDHPQLYCEPAKSDIVP